MISAYQIFHVRLSISTRRQYWDRSHRRDKSARRQVFEFCLTKANFHIVQCMLRALRAEDLDDMGISDRCKASCEAEIEALYTANVDSI